MKPIEVLHKKNATKQQLRCALAESLGVEWHESNEEAKSPFKQCLNYFLEEFKNYSKLDYSFTTKDGIALAKILKKINDLTNGDNTVESFQMIIKNLPDWYKNNAFSLVVINTKFNEIIAAIKTKPNISHEYKKQVFTDLFK